LLALIERTALDLWVGSAPANNHTHASLAATGSDPCVRRTQVLLCFEHCWHAVGMTTAKVYFVCSFRKEECCSMRVHLDRKRLDGDAIAFVVITLLIVIAFAY